MDSAVLMCYALYARLLEALEEPVFTPLQEDAQFDARLDALRKRAFRAAER